LLLIVSHCFVALFLLLLVANRASVSERIRQAIPLLLALLNLQILYFLLLGANAGTFVTRLWFLFVVIRRFSLLVALAAGLFSIR